MTDTNSWSISFLDQYYDIVQTPNNNLRIDLSASRMLIATHPTQLTKFYINSTLFDQTLCTSPVSSGRDDLITKILALSAGSAVDTNVNVVSSVPISINNFPVNQPVTVSPNPLPVSGTVAVTQSTSPWVTSGSSTVSGTVAVSNFPITQPVSGTVSSTQGTSPWVTSGTVAVSNFPATQPVSISSPIPLQVQETGISTGVLSFSQQVTTTTASSAVFLLGLRVVSATQITINSISMAKTQGITGTSISICDVYYNPTVTGGTWTSITGSIVQFQNLPSTSGGMVMHTTNFINEQTVYPSIIIPNGAQIVLVVEQFSAGTLWFSINWSEQH